MKLIGMKLAGEKTIRTTEIAKTRCLSFSRMGKTGKSHKLRVPISLSYTVRNGFVSNEYTFDQLASGMYAYLEKNYPRYDTASPEIKAQVKKQATVLVNAQAWQKQYPV